MISNMYHRDILASLNLKPYKHNKDAKHISDFKVHTQTFT